PRSCRGSPEACASAWSWLDDDLAEDGAILQQAMTFGQRVERQPPREHRREAPLLEQREDAQEVALRPHRVAEDPEVLEEDAVQVQLDPAAGRRPAGDEPPAAREARDAALERRGADVLEHDVDSALPGQPAHL